MADRQNPVQYLQQSVGHRFGWSIVFLEDDDGHMQVTIGTNRPYERRVFRSSDQDLGKRAAAALALEGLAEEIAGEEKKPVQTLADLYPKPLAIYESNDENWHYFWSHRPPVVGIDVEGNQKQPPVLVQVAVNDYVILEAPQGSLSAGLQRLFDDSSIVKVFCDNFAHKDKRCLGLAVPANMTTGSIVDLEAMASEIYGPTSVARGLTRIVSMLRDARVEKPNRSSQGRWANIGRYAAIEQGKAPPLRSVWQLSEEERRYAALDAVVTLDAYQRLQTIRST